LPWSDASISGWILDPDRKKMSKSKGNVVTPMDLLDEHGSDGVRYWAASGRPGTDTAFDVGQMKVGRRLTIKVLNASKFALSLGGTKGATPSDVTEALDQAMLAQLANTVTQATKAFEEFNYTRALEAAESFFWQFCDDYVELVKDRVYGARGDQAAASAKAALGLATQTYLKLFAPFLPFVTDEVWSWWQEGSVHKSTWPASEAIAACAGSTSADVMVAVSDVLSQIRKVKSEAQVSMKTEIVSATITAPASVIALAQLAESDLLTAGRVTAVTWTEGSEISVEAVLATE
jgi:valyl-tRNA synthetase